MKWFEKIVEKYGSEKVAKFVLAGYVSALSAAIGAYGIIGALAAVGYEVYNQKKDGGDIDRESLMPVIYGSLASVVLFLLF